MTLTEAWICHATEERLRIRIGRRKGDLTYLTEVKNELKQYAPAERIEVNVLTASVLIVGQMVEVEELAVFAEQRKLFKLSALPEPVKPLSEMLMQPVREADRLIQSLTEGRFDLVNLAILTLITTGVIGVIRGYRTRPPWYTAFWYAFSILSMTRVNQHQD